MSPTLFQQFENLVRSRERSDAARLLAGMFGAEDLVIFLRDEDLAEWVAAPGFESRVPTAWQNVLNGCAGGTNREERLERRAGEPPMQAMAQAVDAETAWILFGGQPDAVSVAEGLLFLPLVAATFRAEQKIQRLESAATDIEETRESLGKALEAAESAGKAKDEFLASLSNELRAPLNPVLMAAEAMQGDSGLPKDIRDQAEIIRRNAQLEARLIDDLLDITRVRHGTLRLTPHPVNLHELLSQTEEVVKSDDSGKQVTIEFHKQAVEPFVSGDAARLEQVFWNIIRNAAKFTPQGGRVQVITDNPRPGRVVVHVTDSGVGIDPALLPRIFDAFERAEINAAAQTGGLGLGLAISRAIVELHGGQIRAESAGRGKGATFSVELDTIAKPISVSDTPFSLARATTPRLRLLLVEDHDPTREVLGRILGRAGHKVYAVANSQEALQIAGGTAPFDVVISDLGLPDESGFALMRTLKAKFGLPGIAISGFGMEEDVENAKAAGFSAHLTKPVAFEDLRAALDAVTSAKRG